MVFGTRDLLCGLVRLNATGDFSSLRDVEMTKEGNVEMTGRVSNYAGIQTRLSQLFLDNKEDYSSIKLRGAIKKSEISFWFFHGSA